MIAVRIFFKYLLALFWIGAGVNHFANPDFYVPMMPDYFPLHRELVLLSGVTEILAGLMVAIPRTTKYGAWFCIAHLVIFFTVHIHMIQHADRYVADVIESVGWVSSEAEAVTALWIRLPVQVVFILWAFWFTREPKAIEEKTEASAA